MNTAVSQQRESNSIRYLKGVGGSREKVFNRLGIYTLRDLLYYFPFRYEDRSEIKRIKDLILGEPAVVRGKVRAASLKKIPYFVKKRRIRDIFEIILDDTSGAVRCVWFNQGYLAETITKGDELIVYGKLYASKRGAQITSPQFEKNSQGDSLGVGRIIGIYRLPSGFSQRFMRGVMDTVINERLKDFQDLLPFDIRKKKGIPNIVKSFRDMHFPSSWEAAREARERFIFEELFFSQILVYLRKARHRQLPGKQCQIKQSTIDLIRKNFSYVLTGGQEKALSDILNDLGQPYPMRRLLQGDVGSGKTLMAAFAAGACADSGFQVACMVPTEVLAYQHREVFNVLFKGLDFFKNSVAVEVITSSTSRKEVDKIHKGLKAGAISIVIGTHSLIQEKINFKNLGLVIIDEQHKFGVAQRSLLSHKGQDVPHCLVMSATPIPRTLALALYGDLDLSLMADLPKSRALAETMWLLEDKRLWAYEFIDKEVGKGRQAYIVYPVIEENEDEDLKSLLAMHEGLRQRFKRRRVAMFHGKMKNQDKQQVIEDFREKRIDILLCTTVIEVGLSIDNATVMLVENPERFGLAQLHQLRGRIQRSSRQPYFILMSKKGLSQLARKRLTVISRESSGFKIAEEDLMLRGPGDFFGDIQHGLPDLKIANPLRDLEILRQARVFAYNTIKKDPQLKEKAHQPIRIYLREKFMMDDNRYFTLTLG
jgi:ATP-dependent DNA helicase RecG